MKLNGLEPAIIWNLFENISNIPRKSKQEEKIRDWVKNWANSYSIQWKEDKIGNLLLPQIASPGCESYPGVVIQAHLDMVAQKTPNSSHNFDNDPIPLQIIDDYVTADGTTLGSDNGIGMAMALATLIDDSFKHGPIEVLLTVDEEAGLTGAFALEKGFFSYKFLLNLDSEVEGEITVSSAGGGDTKISIPITYIEKPSYLGYELEISGLHGGHSGVDIDKARLNAIKLIFEGLMNIRSDTDLWLCDISGGSAHNAIPRDASVKFLVPNNKKREALKGFDTWNKTINRYREIEPNIKVKIEEITSNKGIIQTNDILSLIDEIPHGPIAMSEDFTDLVETSNNLAMIKNLDNSIIFSCSSRSSVGSSLDQVRNELKILGEKFSAEVSQGSGYPGWKSSLDSPFLMLVKQEYDQIFAKEVKLKGTHGGLECGLFIGLNPDLQIVSIGPEIKDAHSPQERVYINSVDIIWRIVKSVLTKMNQLK